MSVDLLLTEKRLPVRRLRLDNVLIYEKKILHRELPYCISNSFSWCDTGLKISPSIHQIKTKSLIYNLDNMTYANVYLYFGTRSGYSSGYTKCNIMILRRNDTQFSFRRDWGQANNAAYDTEYMNVGV